MDGKYTGVLGEGMRNCNAPQDLKCLTTDDFLKTENESSDLHPERE